MSKNAQQLLSTFDALPKNDQHEVLIELLRRTTDTSYQMPSDEELLLAADVVFQELDSQEE